MIASCPSVPFLVERAREDEVREFGCQGNATYCARKVRADSVSRQ
jgi:hypothetical protein